MERVYKVLSATGIPVLDNTLKKQENVEVVGSCLFKSDLDESIEKLNPDIVLVTDKIAGDENLIKTLIALKNKYHYTRFIYFSGALNSRNAARVDALGTLVLVGIYDIVSASKINIDLVMDIIEHPMSESAVSHLSAKLVDNKSEIENAYGGIEYEEYEEDVIAHDATIPNLHVFTSIKPGSGKSFISVNTATAIAKYGKDKPRVALIEGDLQTLSLGTLLGIDEDSEKNMKTVMTEISGLFDNGNLVATDEKLRKANKKIKNCLVRYKKLNNLDVLVGSSMTPEDIDALHIRAEYYTYLIDVLKNEYDVIIVDMNSSIFHVTSFPLLQKAKNCYYILNLDFNNVRNNLRYRSTINSLGIGPKVKYILNENIENTKEFVESGVELEELNFTATDIEDKFFELAAKIPVLPKTVFLNRLYEGEPVVLDKDSVTYTNKAKYEIMSLADHIYPMGDAYTALEKIVHEKKVGFFERLFGKKKSSEDPVKPKREKGKAAIGIDKAAQDLKENVTESKGENK